MTNFDPLGPGTPAWDAFEDYVDARRRKHRMDQHAARQRLRYQVEKHGGNYKEWLAAVRTQASEAA